MITTQKQIRKLFWLEFPNIDRRKITSYDGKGKMYKTDTRVLFCDFVQALHANGQISDNMVQKVTLS
jgi:hypothetical protein